MHASAQTATPVATPSLPLRTGWPSWLETLLVVVAVAALLPLFGRIATLEGRHDRYAPPAIAAAAGSGADVLAAKNEAARALIDRAGWQWGGGMLLALALLKLSRTSLPPLAGAGLALLAWAAAAWAGRVPWPLAPATRFTPGRATDAWTAEPATFVIALAAAGLVALVVGATRRPRTAMPRQTLASRIAFPGFVVATGVGWLLLLDLSAHGPPANRYLAVYHHGHLWLALVALTLVAFLRPWLGRALAATLALAEEAGGRAARALGPLLSTAALGAVVIAIAALVGGLLADARQLTSELGRLWLIVGTAWCFFLRGSPVADALARHGRALPSLARYAWPLAFVAVVLAAMMLATRDMGPLLIASYAAGAFLAAAVAMWWHVRRDVVVAPALLAIALFVAWIAGITEALFAYGAIDEVTAGRLENLAAPLASANDQLALVGWFRAAAPPGGFGLGAIPWCGFGATTACAGVPAQIQSDYTFTALVGAFGETAAWAITIGCALWLHRIVARHRLVTRGEPRLVRHGARLMVDPQAFLSWIGLAWIVLTSCQLAVTVAGNLAVLPLTGVTFPFVSFGMTSLVVNSALLALCLNVNLPGGRDA